MSTYYQARLDGSADAPPPALQTPGQCSAEGALARGAGRIVDIQVALFPPAVPATVSGNA
jgi:hypothetical protein